MPNRTIAIGDIHGCSTALAALLRAIAPQPDDTIITLGDYVDRGIDSMGVLDQLIALADLISHRQSPSSHITFPTFA
jgi:serine/threonine protein phosphatase 1